MDPNAFAEHPSKATIEERARTWPRPQSLAKCLLLHVRVAPPYRSLCLSIRSARLYTTTRRSYAREPPVRFGGKGVANQCDSPTPIGGKQVVESAAA